MDHQEEFQTTEQPRSLGQFLAESSRRMTLQELEGVSSVLNFKKRAKKILLEGPGWIDDVIQAAQKLRKLDGGENLVRILRSTKYNLEQVKPVFKERIIKRALRRSNPTTQIPRGWLS